tara:strand:- start:116 stop:310 length:195 start_codon:yes stop_codon:yes gene_type:complete
MKFKDKKNEPTIVGSSRKGGQIAQDKMTKAVEQLAEQLGNALGEEFIQLEVEPKLQKINKKKLN